MEEFYVGLLALRIIISIIGVLGNTVMMVSILHTRRLKSFEVFLLGLAAANLEEIVIVDIYDILLLRYSSRISIWACRVLKFLTIFGEIGSILFTVLISIYRYQKLRDVHTRVNLPVFMDSLRSALGLAVLCLAVALVFGLPTLLVNMDWSRSNSSSLRCPVDFFQCTFSRCPTRIYKYSFLVVCNLLPLLIVTLTSSMIIRILVIQQKVVRARQEQTVSTTTTNATAQARTNRSSLQRSTVAILVAMTLFQLNWSVYLTLHLAFDPYTFPLWSEVEFFITTFYTALSPYVYGLGNNLFSVKRFMT